MQPRNNRGPVVMTTIICFKIIPQVDFIKHTGGHEGIFQTERYVGVSKNNGTPKSSSLIGFSIINHPFWGIPLFLETPMYLFRAYLGMLPLPVTVTTRIIACRCTENVHTRFITTILVVVSILVLFARSLGT